MFLSSVNDVRELTKYVLSNDYTFRNKYKKVALSLFYIKM